MLDDLGGDCLNAPAQSGTTATFSIALRLAAAGLAAVAAGAALDDALAAGSDGTAVDRAAAQDIAYSACRRLNLLDALAAALQKKSNHALDSLVRAAVSELIDHADRAHMIVDQAVKAIAPIRAGAYKGALNAILRRFLRERDALLATAMQSEPVRLGYPAWWIERTRAAWGQHAGEVLAQGNTRAPMTLRINRRRAGVEQYLRQLHDLGIDARPLGGDAIHLARPQPARLLPGFGAGLVSVQDLGAQLAAPLLDVSAGMRVLDACAAPGGKTAHLLEIADCELLAIDRDAARLRTVSANLLRLGLKASLRAADAADIAAWWDGRPFDRILLDAPCTASGVIRRHPDGKWLKRESDIALLAKSQARLLDALWQVLRPGGKLLYATCSVFPDENNRQTARFLTSHPDASSIPIDQALTCRDQARMFHSDGQLLPGALHDGFFYALLVKRPA